ncbi:MAG: DedA family protein [Dehalococcoidia bacterium]|nr:DedA family protein [Dehalococcoidia bacterium]
MSTGQPVPEETDPAPTAPPLRFAGLHVRWLIFLLVLSIVLLALTFRHEFTDIQKTVRTLGYPAIFIVALVGAAGMVIPLPSTAAIFVGGAFLNPVLVGIVAGAGEALGDVTGYAVGYSGSGFVERSRIYPRIKGWVQRRGWPVIMLFALIPNPVFDFLGIAAGALRIPLRQFLAVIWVGKTLKNIGLAYAGYAGAAWFLNLFGVTIN